MTQTQSSSPLRRISDSPASPHPHRPKSVYRLLHEEQAAEFTDFLASPLASRLTSSGQLVPVELLRYDGRGLHVYHLSTAFLSYPWEWPNRLWLSAAELTLDVCSQLLAEGWVLNEATPLQITFEGTQPRLTNVLSVERLSDRRPFWMAYAQFVKTFLLPMLAHSQLGRPLQASNAFSDQFDSEEVYEALSRSGRLKSLSMSAVTPVVLLARMIEERLSVDGKAVPQEATEVGSRDLRTVTAFVRKRLQGLRKAMRQAMPSQRTSLRTRLFKSSLLFLATADKEKRSFVADVLRACAPRHVLDIGCGTGVFSRIAAQTGAEVIAIDSDRETIDCFSTPLQGSKLKILPLHVDLAEPATSDGRESGDRLSFLSRCEGRFDTVDDVGRRQAVLRGR